MVGTAKQPEPLNSYVRFSFGFMVGLLILIIVLRLGTPLVAALFTYLALDKFAPKRRGGKLLAVGVSIVLLLSSAYALGRFIHEAVRALPEIADKAIPAVIDTAQKHGLQLPFSDYDSLKALAFDTVKSEVHYLGSFARFARGATTHILFLLVGSVVAMSLFLNPRFDTGAAVTDENLYQVSCAAISQRFAMLYRSFVTIMGHR